MRHALEMDALCYEYVYIRLKFAMLASKNICLGIALSRLSVPYVVVVIAISIYIYNAALSLIIFKERGGRKGGKKN